MNDDDRALLADLDATWDAANRFFARFADVEWARSHGADWIFADVPYHMAIYNRMIANMLLIGMDSDIEDSPSIINLEQLDAWNQAGLRAMRWSGGSADSLTTLRDSQDMLRAAIASLRELPRGLDAPVWLMTLRVRGWRTTRLALEYIQWHNWLHLAETGLRYDSKHPIIAPAALRRALAFNLEMMAGAVDPARTKALLRDKPLRWSLEIKLPESGAIAWTMTIDPSARPADVGMGRTEFLGEAHDLPQVCTIQSGWTDDADITMRTDLVTYLKASVFNMLNPTVAGLTGKLRIKGAAGGANKLAQLFNAPSAQVWIPMAHGRTVAPNKV
ncbi:MAG: SCP2 sterol-binding domain-containing protein [Chloroflexota bacterium]|nr:SCP2 sterol-binding domain-containing protein [Chloroflexota bacterium]